ncbi:MAG: FTR1 family iron permease, partial [Gemmatimonadaceae bacterium]|nr:FTR1 family iron permease [Gemmatimonadaceae bacterium]
ETPVRAKKPALVSTMERYFADFKGAVRRNDMEGARSARKSIEAGIPQMVELARRQSGGWGSFFQSLLIILREGFEAILVIGAVVAFLIKTGHRERLRSIWVGAILGIVASFATAFLLKGVFAYMPGSRSIVEGVTMLIAVAVLFSVSYWLISKVEAAKWQQFIREKVNRSLEEGGGKALALVSFLAVYREGAETALFYQALFSEGNVAIPLSLGILAGFALLAVIFTLFYRFGIRIPMRPFFTATSVLLYFMAFIFMGKGISELQEGDVVPITMIPNFPHIPSLGIFPSVETVAAQALLIILFVFAVAKTWSGSRMDPGSTSSNVAS